MQLNLRAKLYFKKVSGTEYKTIIILLKDFVIKQSIELSELNVRANNSGGINVAEIDFERIWKQDNLTAQVNSVQRIMYSKLLTKC